ncbi:MAG TPA: aconitate hydratase AcnA [Longimicrobiales bacterium]
MKKLNTFDSHAQLKVGRETFQIWRLDALEKRGLSIARLPFSLKILLENLLRTEDDSPEFAGDIEALARWQPRAISDREINFTPARVLLQDFTGVPAVVDLAAMRDAMRKLGGDPRKINPLSPAELVIDHSVQVDEYGTRLAFRHNVEREYERNRERYTFLRWGQGAFRNFRVVPPGTGIVHQVNVEYLARVIFRHDENGLCAYPDTLVGTDSHTTMVNGLGVLGWGVGGIEAEAAMLGQPVAMLIPQVVGFKMTGELPEGATATDLVLTVTEMLRQRGVVGKFVEFFGPGLRDLNVADRATIGNMAPEYGATCGIFPIDEKTLSYLEFTGRSKEHLALVEAYAKEQGLWRTDDTPEAEYSDTLQLDLSTVEPSMAGPRRPQDRLPLSQVKKSFLQTMSAASVGAGAVGASASTTAAEPDLSAVPVTYQGESFELRDGAVVIAAITSCTNTSNPNVMIAAGLVAQKARALGLTSKPWVKTSLAPGSKVVMEYYNAAGLTEPLEEMGFNLVGFGCTTCIGNSGPLPDEISAGVHKGNLVVASVLSGNRNFEGRINSDVRANYLASPPLVVAYAIAGRVDIDLYNEPIGTDQKGRSVFLKDIWPSQAEIQKVVEKAVRPEMFREQYAHVFEGDDLWRTLPTPTGDLFAWEGDSTYVKNPPYFDDMPAQPTAVENITGARVLAILGDSITTDHISPAGAIKANSPAGKYLQENGVAPKDFNSYGSRRGNHEVMMRGTFANIRLRNRITPDVEGGFTKHWPDGEVMPIYDASMKYQAEGVGTVILAGKEYGTGSSRDWAAKGPRLLGVRAVIAESFERIHRSNLIGMGVLPLQFKAGENAETLGLNGTEIFEIVNVEGALAGPGSDVTVRAGDRTFTAISRIDTPQEAEYYRHGGILQYVLRQLAAK